MAGNAPPAPPGVLRDWHGGRGGAPRPCGGDAALDEMLLRDMHAQPRNDGPARALVAAHSELLDVLLQRRRHGVTRRHQLAQRQGTRRIIHLL